MPITVLFPERMYPDSVIEQKIFGPDVRLIMRVVGCLEELDDADCADVDGLMIFRFWAPGAMLARFPKLRAVVRMGVGYDRLDREYAAARGIMICNVPDYGTAEVSDHAMAMVLALRRGLFIHLDAQRKSPPPEWTQIENPLIRRAEALTFGILGIGRMGTAVALRARAFGYRVICFDPYQPNGVERALGIGRTGSLEELLAQSDTLSIHVPLTPETDGLLGLKELSLLPRNAVVVNTARGPILDIEALYSLMKSGHIAGAGLDVIPVEPPVEPVPKLLEDYRAGAAWLAGRVIITPHSAFHTPEAWLDIRVKSSETMRAALLGNRPQNVIRPEMP
jgi:C-terminal binding protein